jgi:hypothetical protein
MRRDDIIALLKFIDIPKDKYIVTMGAVLSVHGVRESSDIDIIFDKSVETILQEKGFIYSPKSHKSKHSKRYVYGECIEAFQHFFHIGNYKKCARSFCCEYIEGIPFMSMKDTLLVKKRFGREKDKEDLSRMSDRFIA